VTKLVKLLCLGPTTSGDHDVFLEEQLSLVLLSLSLVLTMPLEGGTQEQANLKAIASNPAVREKMLLPGEEGRAASLVHR
jgi:hypothetical protein